MCVHQDHTQTVLTVDYSPTGKEFVTGSYDKLALVMICFSSGLCCNMNFKSYTNQ